MNALDLKQELTAVVEDYRSHLDDPDVIEALEEEIERVRASEGNRGLGEFAAGGE